MNSINEIEKKLKKILIKKIEKDGNKSEVKYYIQKDKNMDD